MCTDLKYLSGHLEPNIQAVERRNVPVKAPVRLHNTCPFYSMNNFHMGYGVVAGICS